MAFQKSLNSKKEGIEMKKNSIIRVILALVLVALTALCFASCDKTNNGTAPTTDDGEPYMINGVEIKSISLEMVGETPNLQVVFANNTNAAIKVDLSKFAIKTSDGVVHRLLSLETEIAANTSRAQNAFTGFSDNLSVKIGDAVEIYYGDDLIKATEVEEF